jgi:hypothetical protein
MTKLLSFAFCLCLSFATLAQNKALSGVWKLRAMVFDFDADGKVDRDLWQDCREGSTFSFQPDGSGVQYKGPKPCGKPALNPAPFTWADIDPMNFSIQQGAATEIVRIVSATDNELRLYWTKSKLLLRLER